MSELTCRHPDGCPRATDSGGWCKAHAARVRRSGDPGPATIQAANFDLVGATFGRWTVVGRSEPGREAMWLCECECGARRTIPTGRLRYGDSRSCGCLRAERAAEVHTNQLVSYSGAHQRMRRDRGLATDYACSDCGETAAEWSYTGGDPNELSESSLRYSLSPNFYVPRCVSCHRRHDWQAATLRRLGA